MSDVIAGTTFRKDYTAPPFFIDKTELSVDLTQPNATQVTSILHVRRNTENATTDICLDGQELILLSVAINGEPLVSDQYRIDENGLTIHSVTDDFILSIVTEIYPEKNTSLEGLYKSSSMYCTQCEAEGFHKITYYLDRPDVMSEFTTTLIAKDGEYGTLLSNGNCISDSVANNIRRVIWHDPHKKPCYLFALVAGNLSNIHDTFTTMSGREVALELYVESKDLDKCAHAMNSLKRAMRWDEETYGREYDLDVFMIVAVDDFNMGAMENKGLNIFNTSCVLAHPKTTTDTGFQRVEAVVAHEYFHNWSGNRVTCRDWFQLSLKEGFTVYRDAEFSADMNDRDVKRIEDAGFMRSHQFVEDAGPMAHSIRPDSFVEISNFYTLTIYEKGAEVVRMIANMLGKALFRKASDLYFERHDGEAVTCEDFVVAMEDASGLDLNQFRLWYEQAGTPLLTISSHYDEALQEFTLNVQQELPDTPHQAHKKAMHIPLNVALYGEAGAYALTLKGEAVDEHVADNTELVLHVTHEQQRFVFENISEPVIPSLLRGFSAPVRIDYDYSSGQLARLMQVDSDGFSRVDAGQILALRVIDAQLTRVESADELQDQYFNALACIFQDVQLSPALKVLMLQLPAKSYVLEQQAAIEPIATHRVYTQLQQHIAMRFEAQCLAIYQQMKQADQGQSGEAMAARSLKNLALTYLGLLGDKHQALIDAQYQSAANMTDQLAGLKTLLSHKKMRLAADNALADFYQQFSDESLVVNMWFQLQAMNNAENSLEVIKQLMEHEAFEWTNPNKVRALLGGFSQNVTAFHQEDGAGYDFLAQKIIDLDKINPQIASRLLTPLTHWRRFAKPLSQKMRSALQSIADSGNLSKDVSEVVQKSLV